MHGALQYYLENPAMTLESFIPKYKAWYGTLFQKHFPFRVTVYPEISYAEHALSKVHVCSAACSGPCRQHYHCCSRWHFLGQSINLVGPINTHKIRPRHTPKNQYFFPPIKLSGSTYMCTCFVLMAKHVAPASVLPH